VGHAQKGVHCTPFCGLVRRVRAPSGHHFPPCAETRTGMMSDGGNIRPFSRHRQRIAAVRTRRSFSPPIGEGEPRMRRERTIYGVESGGAHCLPFAREPCSDGDEKPSFREGPRHSVSTPVGRFRIAVLYYSIFFRSCQYIIA
jgi:hypothetical protein